MPRPPIDAPPEVPWSEWWPRFAREYRVSGDSADHVTIIGPTGTGKTTLALKLAELRRYVVVLGCKPRDKELAAATSDYYRVPESDLRAGAGLPSPALAPRVLVWPTHSRDDRADRARHRETFGAVLDGAYSAGGWHVVAEEAPHLIDLGLADRLTRSLRMGRSMASGLILCTQRPRGIPYEAISGAQHLIIFGTNDYEDLRRLGGMNGVDPRVVRETVAGLGRSYRFLHVNTRTRMLTISRFDR